MKDAHTIISSALARMRYYVSHSKRTITKTVPAVIGAKFQKIYAMDKVLQECCVSVLAEDAKSPECTSTKVDVDYTDKTTGECVVNVMLRDREHHNFHLHHNCHRTPCFRYDASGHVHVNPIRVSRELAKRVVPSPHFHKFTDDGCEYAYRTSVIDEQEKALSDIQMAFHAFCHEGKIKCSKNQEPSVELSQTLFPESNLDPLEGHNFP